MARKPERGADEGRRNARRLSDIAYSRILENLFDRQLPAGAFVSQNDLVTLLGIPVGPLRDALRVLEAEGVLKIHPRSGIEFVKPGLELTRSTYQFRTIIERAAVRMFAETASSELLEELHAEHAALITRMVSGEIDPEALLEFERLEARLHNSIVGIMSNPLIEFELSQDAQLPASRPTRSPPDGPTRPALPARAPADH